MSPTEKSRAQAAERRGAAGADDLRRHLSEELVAELASPSRRMPAAHLRRLLDALARPIAGEHDRATLAESAIAARLLARGATLEMEVPTGEGRTADFHVHRDGRSFHLHVKRWTPDEGEGGGATLVVPRAVRRLEQVARPLLVGVRWPRGGRALGAFVREATRFLEQASVGDEFVFRAEGSDAPVGAARVLAPWPGDRVVLTVGIDAAFADEARRLQRLFRKACAQFMPRSDNVILICGGSDDAGGEDRRAIDQALLGSHVERWDLFPPRGQRVAHGRGDDGFWSRGRFNQSRLVVWLPWDDALGLGRPHLWRRGDLPSERALEQAASAALGG